MDDIVERVQAQNDKLLGTLQKQHKQKNEENGQVSWNFWEECGKRTVKWIDSTQLAYHFEPGLFSNLEKWYFYFRLFYFVKLYPVMILSIVYFILFYLLFCITITLYGKSNGNGCLVSLPKTTWRKRYAYYWHIF